MANFTLTSSDAASLVGFDSQADIFLVNAPGRLVGTDTIEGGTVPYLDQLRIIGAVPITLAGADLAHTRGVERLLIPNLAGIFVTLDEAMVASSYHPNFGVFSSGGSDTVLGGGVAATQLIMQGDAGDDWMQGGTGDDLLRPGSGADTMQRGEGADTIEVAAADIGANDSLDGGAGNDDVLRIIDGSRALDLATFGALAGFERIEAPAASLSTLFANISAG
jgi:Ca2+-binding RTX toxin-like protein